MSKRRNGPYETAAIARWRVSRLGIPKRNVGSGDTSISDRLEKRHHSANYVPGWTFENIDHIKLD